MVAGSNKDSKPQECLALYQSMFNHTRDAILWFDCEGRVFHANPAFNGLFGYKGDEVLGQRIDALLG
ncbi:MAG: PAS domain S-box protein, partial [bacterium]